MFVCLEDLERQRAGLMVETSSPPDWGCGANGLCDLDGLKLTRHDLSVD
jgi:hypothetical protein